jgi:tetratricopeptide (TPR) repeat protein
MTTKSSSCFSFAFLCCCLYLGLLGGEKSLASTSPPPPPAKAQASEQSVGALIQKGVEAYRQGHLTEAIQWLKQAHKNAPLHRDAQLLLGLMLYEENSKSIEAQKLMESVAPYFPANRDLQMKLLDSSLQTGRLSSIPSLLARIHTFLLQDPHYGFQVLYILLRYGQIESARQLLSQLSPPLETQWNRTTPEEKESLGASGPKPLYGELLFVRGLIAATRLEKTSALNFFQAADQLDFPPKNSLQMQMLAESLFRLQEYKLAIKAYEVYLQAFPADRGARTHLGLSYYSETMFERAYDAFQQVANEAPNFPDIHFYLGITLLKMKDNQEARRQFEVDLKLNPDSFRSMTEIAYLEYMVGEYETCRQWLDKARSYKRDWTELDLVSGLYCNRQGQYEQAVQYLEKVIKENPTETSAFFQLALAYRRLGNQSKAQEYTTIYEKFLAAEKERTRNEMPEVK